MIEEPIRIELPTLYGMKTVNAFLFTKPEPILIDCGEKSDAAWKALIAALAEYKLSITDIKKVIITHAHVDHIGMAGKIAAVSNATIWVNDYTYPWAINPTALWKRRVGLMKKHLLGDLPPDGEGVALKTMLESFTSIVLNSWDSIPVEKVKKFPIDGTLEMGGATWDVIYAPGHANTQTCFYQKEKKWLIAGDALLKITPTPVFEFSRTKEGERENSLARLLLTLQELAAMDIEKVFPGHYQAFTDHKTLIQRQLNRIEMRKEETYNLIKSGKHRFFEVFDVLYVNRLNMPGMAMLRGYLDLLIAESRIDEMQGSVHVSYQIKK